MVEIELTEDEAKTLAFYMDGVLIDAEGYNAIGVGSKKTVDNIKSIIKKLKKARFNTKK